jgi:predicted phosphoribosyltransferase
MLLSMDAPFRDRRDAGQRLATALEAYAKSPDAIVVGLPRGGVPVAAEVARALQIPMNLLVARKIGAPHHAELAIGAVAEGGALVLENEIIADLLIDPEALDRATATARQELADKVARYRAILPFPDLRDRRVIVVDDGIATGATLKAAIAAIRARHPVSITIAAPIGSRSTCAALRRDADAVICLSTPEDFFSVSQGYDDFEPTTDQDVEQLIADQFQVST